MGPVVQPVRNAAPMAAPTNREDTSRIGFLMKRLTTHCQPDAPGYRSHIRLERSVIPLSLRAPERRIPARTARKSDKPDRVWPADIANVCTSRARARDFFAHTARTNPSRLARSAAEKRLQRVECADGKRSGNVHAAKVHSALESGPHRNVAEARHVPQSRLFAIQNN